MLSLAECRKKLPPNCNLPDSELESLRNQLYGLADISIELFVERKSGSPDIEKQISKLSKAKREKWEERAAIMEFDAGLPRDKAETKAFDHLQEGK